MGLGWLGAWWHQIVGLPPANPWEDDPEIRRERDSQHERGVVDAYQAQRLREETDFWRRVAWSAARRREEQ